MKKLLFLIIITGLAACSTVKTGFDYDRDVDFSRYTTYKITSDGLEESVGQLNSDRIVQAVESELAAKGFTKSDNPDALVDVHIKTEQKVSATATTSGTGVGYGRYGAYGYGGGFSTTHINYEEYTNGTLFISLIDNASQKIVWQGTGTKTLDENAKADKRDKNITYSVQQILLNYPPSK